MNILFHQYRNLKSVEIPKDSQLQEIRSLEVLLPFLDVTHYLFSQRNYNRRITFSKCTNLESVLFSDKSCLQDIRTYAFLVCESLESIKILRVVASIVALYLDVVSSSSQSTSTSRQHYELLEHMLLCIEFTSIHNCFQLKIERTFHEWNSDSMFDIIHTQI